MFQLVRSCTSIPSAAIANAGGAGHGARMPLANVVRGGGEHERPAHGHELEGDVVVQEQVEERDHQVREREVVHPHREPGVPVGRPTGEPALPEPVLLQEPRHPHVGAHVAAVGGRVPEQVAEREVAQAPVVARREDREHDERADADDHPPDRALPERAGLIVFVHDRPARAWSGLGVRDHRVADVSGVARAFVDHGAGHVRQHARPRAESSFTR